MSNETITTNRPPLKLKGGSGRYRKFSCITYLNQIQIEMCIAKHLNQLRAYAYAYHDKDTNEDGTMKEPHYHLVLITYTTCTLSAVRRWFAGFVKDGKDITTTAQKCTDEFEMYKYLTHSTVQAIAAGKYQYDKSIVQCFNPGYFKADEMSNYDNILLATEMLIKGVSVHDCGKKFGRDFILHYRQIKDYLCDVRQWEKFDSQNFDEFLTQQDINSMERSRFQ